MKKFARYFGTAMLAAMPSAAWVQDAVAEQLVYSDSVLLQATDWSENLSIPLFDPSLGTLQSVKIVLNGQVEGSARYENLNATPALVSLDLSAEIVLTRPDLTELVSVLPLANVAENAGAFDNVIDFGGTSGNTFDGLMDDDMEMVTLNSPADLALFTGLGNLLLPATATGASAASGAGNLSAIFTALAAAGVEVTYTYAAVPEPASAALGCIALVGLIGIHVRTRKS